MAEFS